MASFTILDLSTLPAPAVIEELDFEVILADMLADLTARDPEFTAPLESDPAYKVLEVAAYRELLLRQRVNEAAKAVMLAYALDSDLDQIAALFGVSRLAGENNDSLRSRAQQGFAALGAAGPAAAYRAHVRAVSADIIDVTAVSPSDGRVDVVVLARQVVQAATVDPQAASIGAALFPDVTLDDGEAVIIAPNNSPLLLSVIAALSDETVRPLTDNVVVTASQAKTATISARLRIYPGPDPDTVLAQANTRLGKYLASIRRNDFDMTRAGIIAALAPPGVQNVLLDSPASDVVCSSYEVAVATSVNVTVESITE